MLRLYFLLYQLCSKIGEEYVWDLYFSGIYILSIIGLSSQQHT